MNKQEYVQKRKNFQEIIDSTTKEIYKLEREYIEENRKLQKDQQVHIIDNRTNEVTLGVVQSFFVFEDGYIRYWIAKVKKDGTASQQRLRIEHDFQYIQELEGIER